jgi:hypothetical protein
MSGHISPLLTRSEGLKQFFLLFQVGNMVLKRFLKISKLFFKIGFLIPLQRFGEKAMRKVSRKDIEKLVKSASIVVGSPIEFDTVLIGKGRRGYAFTTNNGSCLLNGISARLYSGEAAIFLSGLIRGADLSHGR